MPYSVAVVVFGVRVMAKKQRPYKPGSPDSDPLGEEPAQEQPAQEQRPTHSIPAAIRPEEGTPPDTFEIEVDDPDDLRPEGVAEELPAGSEAVPETEEEMAAREEEATAQPPQPGQQPVLRIAQVANDLSLSPEEAADLGRLE